MTPGNNGNYSNEILPISFSIIYSYSDAGEDYPLKSYTRINIINACYVGSYIPTAYFIFIGI